MPALANNSIITTALWGTLSEQTMISIFHWQYQVGVSPYADYEQTIGGLHTLLRAVGQFRDKYLACCGDNYTLDRIVSQPVHPSRYSPVQVAEGLNGSFGGDASTPNISGTINRRSVYATRWGRGTLHMPAVPDGTFTNGQFDAPYLTALATFSLELLEQRSDPTHSLFTPVLWSYKVPTRITQITAAVPSTIVHLMNRRTVGRGI